jgi:hypothetical protein
MDTLFDTKKFEANFLAAYQRINRKANSQFTNFPFLPWTLVEPLKIKNVSTKYLQLIKEFLQAEFAAFERAVQSENPDAVYQEHLIESYEIANIVCLLAMYVRSSEQRFQEIYKDVPIFGVVIDLCLCQRALFDYLAFFLAHAASSG